MVDVTDTFLSLALGDSNELSTIHDVNIKKTLNKYNCDIIIKCQQLFANLISFEKLLGRVFEDYIGYHRYLPRSKTYSQSINQDKTLHSEEDKLQFDQEIALFIATFAGELNTLREQLPSISHYSKRPKLLNLSHHCHEILNFLYERLNRLIKLSRLMQKERLQLSINPLKLYSKQNIKFNSIKNLTNPINKKQMSDVINDRVSDRYQGEVASVSKMIEYENVALKYKDLLMKEAKDLEIKFSEDLQQAQQVEVSVEQISSMLSEFVRIIHSQTDFVDNVYELSEQTSSFVKKSNQELQTTIDRSQKSQWNMAILCFSLSILLLLLDSMTP